MESFVFVSDMVGVIEIPENFEINQAIEKVLKEADIVYYTMPPFFPQG